MDNSSSPQHQPNESTHPASPDPASKPNPSPAAGFSEPHMAGPSPKRRSPPVASDRAWGFLALIAGVIWLLLLTGGVHLEEGAVFFGLATLILLGLFITRRADGLLVATTLTGAFAVWIELEPSISRWNEDWAAPLFFASFGLAFGLSYALRPRTLGWAIYPGAALLAFATLLWGLISNQVQPYFLPIVLIVAGVLLLALSFRPRQRRPTSPSTGAHPPASPDDELGGPR